MAEANKTEAERRVAEWAEATTEAAETVVRLARMAEVVAQAAAAIAGEVKLERMASAVLDQTLSLLGARAAHLYLADEESRELRLVDQRGLPDDLVHRIERVSFDAPLLATRAARTKQIQVIEDAAALDPALALAHEILVRTGSGAMIAAPLTAFERLAGVLAYAVPGAHRFAPAEQQTILALAELFAIGLVNARAYERESRLRHQIEAISGAALAISGEFELERILQKIVDEARRIAGAELAALGIVEPAGPFKPWVFSGLAEEQAAAIGRFPRPVGLLGAVPAEGRTIRLRSLQDDPRYRGVPPHHPAVTSFLGVPIRHQGTCAGNLYLANKVGGEEFTEEDERAIERLAAHAGAALEQARLRALVEQERAQLRDSEERFRLIAENAHDLITRYRIKPPRGFDYVSPAATAITGYAPEEWYADPNLCFDVVHPDDRPILAAAAEHPEAFLKQPLILRWRRKDGSRLWLEHRVVAVRDEAGDIVSINGIARDITERKRAEEERERLLDSLAAERTWLRAIIDNSPVGVLLVADAEGGAITVNRRFEEIFGRPLSPGEDPAALGARVVRPDGSPLARADFPRTRALRGERFTGEELRIVRADGREIPVLVSAGPLRDAGGRVTGAVVVFEDIAALKDLERLREEWTSIIAHDLRQPVSVITGYGGVLAQQAGAEETPSRRALTHILAAARQLDRMINDLLDVSRIDARRLTLERQTTDLPALVRAVVERAVEITKTHPVEVSVEGDVPEVSVDPGRLEQIVDNLLSNAAKYGAPGAEVRVEVARRGGEVQVSVVNWGRGIPAEDVPSLFARYHRTSMAKDERVPGVGLGLYITKGLVEAHGGRIWVESSPGETTAFRFVLPISA